MTRTRPTWLLLTTLPCALLASGCGGELEHREPEHAENTSITHDGDHEEPAGGHGHDEHGDEGVVELSPEAIDRIGLRTEPLSHRTFASLRTTTGTVGFDEERLAHVAPRVSGRLVEVPGALGATVAAGEVLATLDSTDLGEARAAYLRAQAHHEVALRRHERQLALSEEEIASEQELLESEAEARESAADLAAARETLRLLGMSTRAIESLSWDDPDSSLVRVRAPFAGRIIAREATIGELVSPQDILFTLADLEQVWLWVDLYERDLAHVSLGDRAEVRVDSWPDDWLIGRLSYIGDEVEPTSRTVRARIDLPNTTHRLKPGMFARVALSAGEEPVPTLALPRTAVQRDGNETVVFVQTAAGRFERHEVQLGRTGQEFVEILDGVAAGDEVVVDGSFLLRSQASADELGGHHH